MTIANKTDYAFLEERENLKEIENKIDVLIQNKSALWHETALRFYC